ncbi:MAG: protein kinase [Prevotella sp.]|nr:protein kinase [Prevotella sp.]
MEIYSLSLPVGTILKGKSYSYRIQKILGQGSFGITYLASVKMEGALGSINANVQVAIKEFFMQEINGRDGSSVTSGSKQGIYSYYKKKFIREAQNLSKLNHQNIINVLESFEANNTIYFAMEYIDGGSLDQLIYKKGRLSANECVKFSREIAEALKFMHANGMLHLDLKPANIMLRNGSAVLIDFGLSKQYNEKGEPESSTTVGSGTPGYAPLEQADYHDGKGFPVTMDIYALGGTMFKMLTGHRPPEASVILNEGFPEEDLSKLNIPSWLSDLVMKCMSPTRKARYQSVEPVLQVLKNSKVQASYKIYNNTVFDDGKKYNNDKNDNTFLEDNNISNVHRVTKKTPISKEASATPLQTDFNMWRDRNKVTNFVIIFALLATTATIPIFSFESYHFIERQFEWDKIWVVCVFGIFCIDGELRILKNKKYWYSPLIGFIIACALCNNSPFFINVLILSAIFLLVLLFLLIKKNGVSGFKLLRDYHYGSEESKLSTIWNIRHWTTNIATCIISVLTLLYFMANISRVYYSFDYFINPYYPFGPIFLVFLYSLYLIFRNIKISLLFIPICLIILAILEIGNFNHIECSIMYIIITILYIVQFMVLLIRKNGYSALSLMEKFY